jgi:1,4-alpha-glucan branching enzyme
MARLAVRKQQSRGGGRRAQPGKGTPRRHSTSRMAAKSNKRRGRVLVLQAPPAVRQVNFGLSDANAVSVSVAGTFNNWNPHVSPLRSAGAGQWSLQMMLEPGRYEYRFLVDGKWKMDPAARQQVTDFCGGGNSVLLVE